MILIKVFENNKLVRSISVSGSATPIIIGRSHDATVQIQDPMCSGIHCQLFLENGRLVVKDLKSRNGTFINKTILVDKAYVYLTDNVTIGECVIVSLDASKMTKTELETHTDHGGKVVHSEISYVKSAPIKRSKREK